jgi:Tol biopolymer transport system component
LRLLERAGAGASGEIWRAWDPSLQREVALKFLHSQGGTDNDAALLEEARTLARVRHPGVLAVHGIGTHAGRIGMWMELLVGKTLEMEIQRRGPLAPREVARIGLELCNALEAIQAAGLVHRDIKPANVILESSGRIVLTDFGLGRRLAFNREARGPSGTPLFMSPELLSGEPATPRSDLYALGVTLRWALTGSCPFQAKALDELRIEAERGPSTPLHAERPDAPAALVEAIERAMAPRAEARYPSAARLADAMKEILAGETGVGKRWVGVQRITAGATAILLTGAVAFLLPRVKFTPPQPVRFSVTAPPNTTLIENAQAMAISPDGRTLAFVAADSAGTRRIWLRPLESLDARPLEGTENGTGPFWSPDGRALGFFANMKLKKVSVSGGTPETLCDAPDGRGASWGKNGVIVFAPVAAGSLCRVSSEGGSVTEILEPDSTHKETALRWPQFLPDGKRFLFVALPPRNGIFDVFASEVGSRNRQWVMSSGCAPICAGRKGLILANNGRLLFQKFDFRRLRPVGSPVAIGTAPVYDASVGQPLASASMTGVLVQPNEPLTNTRLVWLGRSGQRTGELTVPDGRYERLFFAPDGRQLIAERRHSPIAVDLWMIDLERGEARLFTQGSQSRIGGRPVWSPEGKRIAFSSNRLGRTNIYQRLVDEAGEEELLYQSNGLFKEVDSWSPDGRFLVFEQADPITGWDLWLLPINGKREPIPYLRSRFDEFAASVSPDGRWLAYITNATGKYQVYIRSFPKPGVEHLVSDTPGTGYWSKDGSKLLVMGTSIQSVPISTRLPFRAGTGHALFRTPPEALCVAPVPSGDRFLATLPLESAEPPTITVDLNLSERVRP